MIKFWRAKLRHHIGQLYSEVEINDIPAQSKSEAQTKALRYYAAKIAPGSDEQPHIVSIEEDRSVITGIISKATKIFNPFA